MMSGPFRMPVNMLVAQEFGGHTSIHDDATAERLSFVAGPVEGPTHFSQFVPLLDAIWGKAWHESGCFSVHFQNLVVEGEKVKAFATLPEEDGTPVFEASASLGAGPTLLDERMVNLRPVDQLVILEDLKVGQTGAADEPVIMYAEQNMGALYPFSLTQKLNRITEYSPWYSEDSASPWGRAIIPLEMISVLAEYTSISGAQYPIKGPAIGLFADQEIRVYKGPLFVGQPCLIRREIVALAESRRTESYWVCSKIYDESGAELLAEIPLNHAKLKDSYAPYAAELTALKGA